jgi:hypothetical protein
VKAVQLYTRVKPLLQAMYDLRAQEWFSPMRQHCGDCRQAQQSDREPTGNPAQPSDFLPK